ncbi:MAG: acetate--CoA ligase family protein, partial [Desulfobacterales bacterium]
MKIHEYQSKELFKKYDIPIPNGGVAFSPEDAVAIAEKLDGYPVVVKAQIHAGGRGKGGGVKLAESADELRAVAQEIIGMNLVTHQTGPEGKLVKKILVEQGLNIEKELYLSVVPDRTTAKIVVMASEAGGMDIEEVAAKTPQKIIKIFVNPLLGIQAYHCRKVAYGLNLSPELIKPFGVMLRNLYQLFIAYDCSLVEINPL